MGGWISRLRGEQDQQPPPQPLKQEQEQVQSTGEADDADDDAEGKDWTDNEEITARRKKYGYQTGQALQEKYKDKIIFCNAVNHFGLDLIVDDWFSVINQNYPHDKYDWISVGSGKGLLESFIAKEYKREIICIDPNPFQWSLGQVGILPKFPTVKDYLTSLKGQQQPEPKSRAALSSLSLELPVVEMNSDSIPNPKPITRKKRLLILVWPDPYLNYDMEAIRLLEPDGIIILTENTNDYLYKNLALKNPDHNLPGASSMQFWKWMEALVGSYVRYDTWKIKQQRYPLSPAFVDASDDDDDDFDPDTTPLPKQQKRGFSGWFSTLTGQSSNTKVQSAPEPEPEPEPEPLPLPKYWLQNEAQTQWEYVNRGDYIARWRMFWFTRDGCPARVKMPVQYTGFQTSILDMDDNVIILQETSDPIDISTQVHVQSQEKHYNESLTDSQVFYTEQERSTSSDNEN
jgi:hypothetical protein